MKNVIDASGVIALRRQGFFQVIVEKLAKQAQFDNEKLFYIIRDIDNMSFLTKKEKNDKKINPQITALEISKENPQLLETIISKLQKNYEKSDQN